MKKVIVAKSAGFCWGVRRAFDKALDVAAEGPASEKFYTYGPLIHNPQAIAQLKEKGVDVLEEIPEKISGTVFIRTHGLSPDERARLKNSGAKIVDATCPDVGVIQGIVRKHVRKGYKIIIIGDKKHPEVNALLGYAEGDGVALLTKEEILKLPADWPKLCVVSQSTQKEEKFFLLVKAIKDRYPDAEIFNTICASTTKRQEETKNLANGVDAMVVVGGHNSANTAKLTQVSEDVGTKTLQIETEDELKASDFEGFDTIGVTAGASTPTWLIERVVKKLTSFA